MTEKHTHIVPPFPLIDSANPVGWAEWKHLSIFYIRVDFNLIGMWGLSWACRLYIVELVNHTLRVSSIKCAMIEVVRSQNSLHTRNSVDQNETYTIHMRNSVGWCRTVCARSSRPTNWLPQSWIWSPLLLDSQQHASHLQSTSREHNMDYKYQILNKKIR